MGFKSHGDCFFTEEAGDLPWGTILRVELPDAVLRAHPRTEPTALRIPSEVVNREGTIAVERWGDDRPAGRRQHAPSLTELASHMSEVEAQSADEALRGYLGRLPPSRLGCVLPFVPSRYIVCAISRGLRRSLGGPVAEIDHLRDGARRNRLRFAHDLLSARPLHAGALDAVAAVFATEVDGRIAERAARYARLLAGALREAESPSLAVR